MNNFVKKTAFIIHGTGGHPLENWFPWLKEELEKKDFSVFVPQFPNADKPLLEPWLQELEKYKDKIDNNTIFIAHSIGCLFLLRVLERLKTPVKASFFVAPSVGIKPIKFYEGDYNFSNGFTFNWEKIKSNAGKVVVFHSDNDPYISIDNGKEVAHKLGVELTFVSNAGHFNATAGYTKFELLRDKILEL